MAKIPLLGLVLLSALVASCSSRTEALGDKSLMSRPLLDHSSTSQPAPDKAPAKRSP